MTMTDEQLRNAGLDPNGEAIIVDIGQGRLDLYLIPISNAIVQRRKHIAELRAQSLKVGDRVVLQGLGAGAKYLNGMTGTVTGFATKNIKVRIDSHFNTRRYGHELRVPPTLLRVATPLDDPMRIGHFDDEEE